MLEFRPLVRHTCHPIRECFAPLLPTWNSTIWIQFRTKSSSKRRLGAFSKASCIVLGSLGGLLALFGAVLGPIQSRLGMSWEPIGPSMAVLETSWIIKTEKADGHRWIFLRSGAKERPRAAQNRFRKTKMVPADLDFGCHLLRVWHMSI